MLQNFFAYRIKCLIVLLREVVWGVVFFRQASFAFPGKHLAFPQNR
jgi:hypothetical protein